MKFLCTKKCFYKNRLWTPGETLVSDDINVPKHFKNCKDIKVTKIVEDDSIAMSQIQKKYDEQDVKLKEAKEQLLKKNRNPKDKKIIEDKDL